MKNLLYLIGLVAIAAVALSVMETNDTNVDVPVSSPAVKEVMQKADDAILEVEVPMVEEAIVEPASEEVEA